MSLKSADQPGVLTGITGLLQPIQKRQLLLSLQILEENLHITAADHPQIGHIILFQTISHGIGRLLLQKLPCMLLRRIFHRTPADGPLGMPVPEHEHHRSRSSGRGTRAGQDTDQNQRLMLLQCPDHRFNSLFHIFVLLSVRCASCASPDLPVWLAWGCGFPGR